LPEDLFGGLTFWSSLADRSPSPVVDENCVIPADFSCLRLHRSIRENLASTFSYQGGVLDSWIWCHNYIRPLALLPGQNVHTKMRDLVKARNPLVGRYRLNIYEVQILWKTLDGTFIYQDDWWIREHRSFDPYFERVVRDLMEQSCFNEFFSHFSALYGHGRTFMSPLLRFSTTTLPFDMIDRMQPQIHESDIVAAVESGRLIVFQSLCEKIRDLQLVTYFHLPQLKLAVQQAIEKGRRSASKEWNVDHDIVFQELEKLRESVAIK